MDNTAELRQRRIRLLDNNNLSDSVNKMIKVKHLPAELDSVTTIAGRYGKTEIVLRLLISKSNIDRVVKTYIYLTEDMFDLDSFKYIDKELDSVIIFKSRQEKWLDKEFWGRKDDLTSFIL